MSDVNPVDDATQTLRSSASPTPPVGPEETVQASEEVILPEAEPEVKEQVKDEDVTDSLEIPADPGIETKDTDKVEPVVNENTSVEATSTTDPVTTKVESEPELTEAVTAKPEEPNA